MSEKEAEKEEKKEDKPKEEEEKEKKKKKKEKKDKDSARDKEKDSARDKKKKKKDKDREKEKAEDEDEELSSPRSRIEIVQPDARTELKIMPPIREESESGERRCYLHSEKIVFYCETCQEPVCDKCLLIGPHNNQLHRINNIDDSYRPRAQALQKVLETKLLPKREHLITQMQRIDNRIEKIRYVKSMIEKDLKAEFARMLEQLKDAEGSKVAVLLHDVATLQKEVDKIDDLTSYVERLTKETTEPIELLVKVREVGDELEYTASRPFKEEIEITPELPMELEEQREKLEKLRIAEEIIEFKDGVIAKLIKEKEEHYRKLKKDIEDRAVNEINAWVGLTDRCNKIINERTLVCFFCGETPKPNEDDECKKAEEIVRPLAKNWDEAIVPGYSINKPSKSDLPSGFRSTFKHFYGPPIPEIDDISQYDDPRVSGLLGEPELRTQYNLFLEMALAKIKKHYIAKMEEIEKLFEEHDKEGFISKITFEFILHEVAGIELKEVKTLETFLIPDRKGHISYIEMLRIFNDSLYLAEYIKRRIPAFRYEHNTAGEQWNRSNREAKEVKDKKAKDEKSPWKLPQAEKKSPRGQPGAQGGQGGGQGGAYQSRYGADRSSYGAGARQEQSSYGGNYRSSGSGADSDRLGGYGKFQSSSSRYGGKY